MRTLLKVFTVLLFCSVSFIGKAQITLDSDGFKIGNSQYSPLIIHDRFGLEEWEDGFNFWVPWPNTGSGNYKLFIDKTGKVGINRKPTTYKLEVGGDLYIDGTLLQTSDVRLKDNIINLNNANFLDKIEKISGKAYVKKSTLGYIPEEEVKKMVEYGKIEPEEANTVLLSMKREEKSNFSATEFGFIAQELQEILPELVNEGSDGYLAIDYNGLIPILVESIKELKQIVDSQNKELEAILSNYITNKK